MIGRILADRYELLRLLGRGGMGEVWEAHDARIRRRVAVKLLPHDLEDPTGAELFLREAHITGGLRHPGVVTVFDLGQEADTGTLYLVMELLEGRDLARVLRDAGPPEIAVAVNWSAQVAGALSVAHANGVVHRDLKPSNLMLTAEGAVKVLDFGIARFATSTTRSTQIMGTLAYMAPERVRGQSGDTRGDLYSLGWVLHELITGKTPFGTTEPMALMYAHLETPPEPPGALRGGVPPELDALVLALLAKNPDDRPSSAAETAELLTRIPGIRYLPRTDNTAPPIPAPLPPPAPSSGPPSAPPQSPPGATPTDLRIPAPPARADAFSGAPGNAHAFATATAAGGGSAHGSAHAHAHATAAPSPAPLSGHSVVIGPGGQPTFPARSFVLGRKSVAIIAACTVVVALVAWLVVRGLGDDSSPNDAKGNQPTNTSTTGNSSASSSSSSAPSSSSPSSASTATASTRTATTTTTAAPAFVPTTAAQTEIVQAYSLVFSSTTPVAERKQYIQDADKLNAFIDEIFANPMVATVGVSTSRADVTGNTADVRIKWLTNGVPVTGEVLVSAVKQNGRWRVGADAICSIGATAGARVPAACSGY
ncbi:serine/threonine protein kinase [Streptomycetaceae bacterium NBC_01309]